MKRISIIVLVMVLIISSLTIIFTVSGKAKDPALNVKLLDSILTDRAWIVESLVEGDVSNNPYAYINPASTGQNILEEVLKNYNNNEAFKALVDAMDVYANSGQYVSGFADAVVSVFEGWFGESNDTVDKIVASTDELKYESIINEVLKTDYTSSWETTLFEENMDMETLNQRANILKKLSTYQTALRDHFNLRYGDSSSIIIYDPSDLDTSSFKIDIDDYVNHFLSAYEADLEKYINISLSLQGLDGNEALKKKIASTVALGAVTLYEKTKMPDQMDVDELFYDGFFSDTLKILDGAGKALKIASKKTDYAILLETLQSQKNTVVETMLRIAKSTSNDDLSKVFDNYADLINEAADNKTISYEQVTNYLRNETVVTNFVTEAIKEYAPKYIDKAALFFGGGKGLVLVNSIARVLGLANLSVWVADKATDIKETAKKVYVCKYLNNIISETVKTYRNDLQKYYNNVNDANAQKVLSDLQFLKELRLYGEKTAYDSMCSQMTSWIGLLLGGGETKDYIDKRYQASIDTYLGCTFSPISNKAFALSENDVLNIMSVTVNGKEYTEANLKKANGKNIYFAEPDYRLMGKLSLNGATVNVYNAPSGLYFPLVENTKSGGTINIYCDNVAFGQIETTAETTINLKENAVSFEITDAVSNSSVININKENGNSVIAVGDLSNKNTINLSNVQFNVIGDINNSGAINGYVNVCGNGRIYNNSYFSVVSQSVSGTGKIQSLAFNSKLKNGIKISGSQDVQGFFSNKSTRLRTPENIYLVGDCSVDDNLINSSISLKDFSSSSNLLIKGTVYTYGDIKLDSARINDGLVLTSQCNKMEINSPVVIDGDVQCNGGAITGTGWLKLNGNLNVSKSSMSFSKLELTGKIPQVIASDYAISVDDFYNHNSSKEGITVEAETIVSKTLNTDPDSLYKDGKQIVLSGDTRVVGSVIKGSISAKDWVCSDSFKIMGTLYTSGSVELAENVNVQTVNYNQTDGSLTINENAHLSCEGCFTQSGTTQNNGTIDVQRDSKIANSFVQTESGSTFVKGDNLISGAITGGTYSTMGDVTASADFSPDNLIMESKINQVFNNTAKTNLKTFTLSNTSKTGFDAQSVINISELYNEHCDRIVNRANIVLAKNATYFYDGATKGDMVISGNFTVPKGETLTVNGVLTFANTAKLTVESGANLIVRRHIVSKGSSVIIEEDGVLQIEDYLNSDSDTFDVKGEMIIKGDAKFTSSTINADGLITIKGDLTNSSSTWNSPNVAFRSMLVQNVSGSSIKVNNLTIDNSSSAGIVFDTKVNYFGLLTENGSAITNAGNIIKNS